MKRTIGIILLLLIILAGIVWQRQQPTADDPLRAEKIELQRAEILRETEKEKQRTEEEKRETARTLATIERQRRVESSKAVSAAAVALALTWRLTFPILFFSGVIGAGVYLWRKPVLFEHGTIRSPVPRHEAAGLAREALAVEERKAIVEALAYAESVTRERMEQCIDFVRAVKPGRETVNISNALPAAAETQPQTGNVPTFQTALHDMIPGQVLLGYSSGKPVFFSIPEFVSCAFGGGSGSGKTSKMRFLLSQLAMNGVTLHILDAHAGDPQSLVNSLGGICSLSNVKTYSPIETRETIQFFMDDLQQAIAHPERKQATVYVIDELLPVVDVEPKTADFLLKVGTEGRKFERYGFFAGQMWPASLFKNGSSARSALVLKMAAKMEFDQAQILFKGKEKSRTVEGLALPQMYASSYKFNGVIDVPFASREDMDALAAKFGAGASPVTPQTTNGETAINDTENLSEAIETTTAQKTGVVLPFRRRNDEETGKEREIKQETPFLSADTLRGILAEKIARNEETLSGIANKAGVSKGQLHRFLKENQTPSENLLTALQVFARTPGTPANSTGTER